MKTPNAAKTYPSAVDLWLAILLIGIPLLLVGMGASVSLGLHYLHWYAKVGFAMGMVLIALGVGLGALAALLTQPCRYTLDDDALHIQAGWYRRTIPYRSILWLELSCSLWIAPALSLNRVKIVIEDGFQLVSPKDRVDFIKALQARMDPGA